MTSPEIQKEQIALDKFDDLRGKDLSGADLSKISPDILVTTDFDTETIWPAKDKLPVGFDPEKLLEDCKNPGLGIRELHEQGIDGRGVTVAIIDQRLDVNHPEYKDPIKSYQEYDVSTEEGISMHGPAVASLFVGKDCGVAPSAKLVYKAKPGGRNFFLEAQALNDIIADNEKLDVKDRVKIVSCSIGYTLEEPEAGIDDWTSAIKKATAAGIFFVDVSGDQINIQFNGGGSSGDKNDFDSYDIWLRDNKDVKLNRAMIAEDVEGVLKRLKEIKKDTVSGMSDIDLRQRILIEIKNKKKQIIVPSDYRTMASSWSKEGQYMYNGKGGLSWSTPYLAGVLALAIQVKPDITAEEFSQIVKETAVVNKAGLRIINPAGIIKMIKGNLK